MQIRDTNSKFVQGVKAHAATPGKVNAAPPSADMHDPKDVVALSDRAKALQADGPPPDPRKADADIKTREATWPRSGDKQVVKDLKNEYKGLYSDADKGREYANQIANMGPGSHTLSDGSTAQVAISSDGVTTVKIQKNGSNGYREIKFKPQDATYLQDNQVTNGFLWIKNTKSLRREGTTVVSSDEKSWWNFKWGKKATTYEAGNQTITQSNPPDQAGILMTKGYYDSSSHPEDSPETSRANKVFLVMANGMAIEQTWIPEHYEQRGPSRVKVEGRYDSVLIPKE
ncbi:MAG: hypothetical protein M1536_08825 [Firmicutes bacterium]|nr:hypothetical protein [Bacillota bacterium]